MTNNFRLIEHDIDILNDISNIGKFHNVYA